MKLRIEISLGLDITEKRLNKLGFTSKNFLYSQKPKIVWVLGNHMDDTGRFIDTIVYDPTEKNIEANYGGSVYMPSRGKAISMTDIKKFLREHPYKDEKSEHEERFGKEGEGFDVILKHHGIYKIGVMKELRDYLKIGLNETKILVNAVPTIIAKHLDRGDAEMLKGRLEVIGAEVELK